jgi:hypothetical protein
MELYIALSSLHYAADLLRDEAKKLRAQAGHSDVMRLLRSRDLDELAKKLDNGLSENPGAERL